MQIAFWGNSVALSWMWGLGLFFSVQITFLFGLPGLLLFAVPNALGLVGFGLITQRIAEREPGGDESLALFFDRISRPLRPIFYLYQVVALSLTVFALVNYSWGELRLASGPLQAVYLGLIVVLILGVSCWLGEEFGFARIKWSHACFGVLLLVGMGSIVVGLNQGTTGSAVGEVRAATGRAGAGLAGYVIPLLLGMLAGPWLDLQQWQRAIQMRREKLSIRAGYVWGAAVFFLVLLFHGLLADWVLHRVGATVAVHAGWDGFRYAHGVITHYLNSDNAANGWASAGYWVFLSVCSLTTLDSGYVALKWFLAENPEREQGLLLSLVPKPFLTSPIPTFVVVGAIALGGIWAELQLEYFMAAYAAFFAGYAWLVVLGARAGKVRTAWPQLKLVLGASVALMIFALGYLSGQGWLMTLGSLVAVAGGIGAARDGGGLAVAEPRGLAPTAVQPAASIIPAPGGVAQAEHYALGGHFEGNWFVHSLIVSYADTNSVGNVYFGMYGMFVGKAREMFFNAVMPKFDLKTTSYFILTRSYEHRFLREAKEFDTLTVKIRVANHNRRFCTLEHQIVGANGEVVGRGEQGLMFVSAKDYSLLDVPTEVYQAFIKYAGPSSAPVA
jgi:acyl-CoA thioesterase FadM